MNTFLRRWRQCDTDKDVLNVIHSSMDRVHAMDVFGTVCRVNDNQLGICLLCPTPDPIVDGMQ
jgi:hypothetical protein